MTFHIELIGHLAYLLIALSYAARNLLWLRLLAIPACIFGIVFGFYLENEPIWVIVFWNSLFLLINCVQLIISWMHAASLGRNEDAEKLLDFLYPMSRSQVSRLVSIGQTRVTSQSEILLDAGGFTGRLYLIVSGSVSIWKKDEQLAICGPGTLLGDISFLTRQPCTATAIADKGVQLIEWKAEVLRSKLVELPELQAVFSRRLAKDISTKLIRSETAESKSEQELQLH